MKLIIFNFSLIFLLMAGCVHKRHEGHPVPATTVTVRDKNDTASLRVLAQPAAARQELEKAKKVVEECVAAYQKMEGYSAVILKKDRLQGQGEELREEETIFVKFRKPNQIYMKWVKEPNKGRELIYPVKGDKMVVQPGGWIDLITPRLYLHPTDKLAMLEHRHPVTESNMGFLIRRYAADFGRALAKNEAQIHFENPGKFGEKPAHRLELILPDSPLAGYYCYRSVFYFDPETKLPLEVEFYDWENKLFERYTITQLQINPGLTDKDFDENNKQYDF